MSGWLTTVRIIGHSMEPDVASGDVLLVVRRPFRRVRRGQLIAFANPQRGGASDPLLLTKRVAAVPGDPIPADMSTVVSAPDGIVPPRAVLVRGAAERTLDSRHFGFVPAGTVRGVCIPLCIPCALRLNRMCAHPGRRDATSVGSESLHAPMQWAPVDRLHRVLRSLGRLSSSGRVSHGAES